MLRPKLTKKYTTFRILLSLYKFQTLTFNGKAMQQYLSTVAEASNNPLHRAPALTKIVLPLHKTMLRSCMLGNGLSLLKLLSWTPSIPSRAQLSAIAIHMICEPGADLYF